MLKMPIAIQVEIGGLNDSGSLRLAHVRLWYQFVNGWNANFFQHDAFKGYASWQKG
jgi:hypothetical protein